MPLNQQTIVRRILAVNRSILDLRSSILQSLRLRSLVVSLALLGKCTAAEFFVSETGQAFGDGSANHPWDLATALAHPKPVQPGDTIWVGAGRYNGGFASKLKGVKGSPITVRAGEGRVTIDCKPRDMKDSGAFQVDGEWTIFRGFEVTCSSDTKRITSEKGSWPDDIRRGGISARGSHLHFINMIVHDTAQGFGFWGNEDSGEGGEIYGCIIYHNGWLGPDRGHGHGIYAQNARGTKRIVDNVIFNQFGYGVHAYGSEKAHLRGFHVEGNAIFNNGSLCGASYRATDLAVGGGTAMEDITISGNGLYGGGGLQLGYGADVSNRGVIARDNCVAGHCKFTALAQATFTGNEIIAPGTLASFQHPLAAGAVALVWDNNTYLRTKREWAAFNIIRDGKTSGATFEEWRAMMGSDAHSKYAEASPRGIRVIVRPNLHEKGRAHIIVYNWDRADAVTVDLSTVLASGQPFRIVSAQNVFGAPIHSGAYASPVQLPMNPTPPHRPIGMPEAELPVTEPEFGVFLVLPRTEF